jgi:hypothetical protein
MRLQNTRNARTLGSYLTMRRASAETEPEVTTGASLALQKSASSRGIFKKPQTRPRTQQMGSAFTDWRNSVESAVTGGASDALPPINITLPGQAAPVAKPVAKQAIPGTILGIPTTTAMLAGFAGLLAWKFLR